MSQHDQNHHASRQNTFIILLCGGDKATQAKDILRAHVLSEQVEEQLRNEK